jgi:hypothetical protein
MQIPIKKSHAQCDKVGEEKRIIRKKAIITFIPGKSRLSLIP